MLLTSAQQLLPSTRAANNMPKQGLQSTLAIAAACFCYCAGQYNDAAYSLVQLRKILEDSNSSSEPGGKQVLPGSELAALQAGCTSCETALEEVRHHRAAAGAGVGRGGGSASCAACCTVPALFVRCAGV